MAFLSLAEVKQHCIIDHDEHDSLISGYMQAAETYVADHTRRDFGIDFAGGVPAPIRQAAMMLVCHWFANREAVIVGTGSVLTPVGVTDLLAKYRVYS